MLTFGKFFYFADVQGYGMTHYPTLVPCHHVISIPPWAAAEDHVLMANCTFDHCQLNGAKWPFAVLRQARGSNVASWQQKKVLWRCFWNKT